MSEYSDFHRWSGCLSAPVALIDKSGLIVALNTPFRRALDGASEGVRLESLVEEDEPMRRFLSLARRTSTPCPGRLKLRGSDDTISCDAALLLVDEKTPASAPILLQLRPHESENRFQALKERIEALETQQAMRRRAEEELSVIFHGAGALIVVRAGGSIQSANRAAESLFSQEPGSLTNLELEAFLVLPGGEGTLADLIEMTAHTAPAEAREPLRCLSRDQTRTIEVRTSSLMVGGKPSTLLALEDITDQEEARRARERLAAVVTSSRDAIITGDTRGVITSWNSAAEKLFGYTTSEAMGMRFHRLHPPGSETVETMIARRVGVVTKPVEVFRIRRDGSQVLVEMSVSALRGADGEVEGVAMIARDITERKQHEAEILRSNAELAQFAYVASHDLQEPLRMVANYTELLGERYKGKLDERADTYIHYAVDGAKRMQRMINDLLAYSYISSKGEKIAPVDAAEAGRFVLRVLGPRIREANAEVHLRPLPTVMADDDQLVQLLINLIGNALKFRSPERPSKVWVEAQRDGQMWHFQVRDNGIGFDPKFKKRVFEIFQRLHRAEHEGSGVGLALCQRIVDRHGGRIWAEPEVGKGATFHFTLKPAPS